MADILGATTAATRKTQVMYESSTTYAQLSQYLGELQEANLIEENLDDDIITYRTTEKGREFLRQFGLLCRLIEKGQSKTVN